MRQYNIVSDLVLVRSIEPVVYKQYDNGDTLEVELYQDNEKIILTNEVVLAFFELEDKTVIQKTCVIKSGNAIATLDNNILSLGGKVKVEFTIVTSGKQTTTRTLLITVETSINRNEAVETVPQWDIISQLLKDGPGIIDGVRNLESVGDYSPSVKYKKNNIVRFNGSGYIARKDAQGIPPTDTNTWTKLVDKGDTGARGPQGEQGIQGIKGDTGLQGIQGLKGDQGIQGQKGEQGIQGLKGEQGIQGFQGEKGDIGEQGIQGVQGEKGDQGVQGERGIQGVKGDTGEQGIQGVQGEKGDQGIQGERGFVGPKGDTGIGLSVLGSLTSEDELPLTAALGEAYLIGGKLFVWVGSGWETVVVGSAVTSVNGLIGDVVGLATLDEMMALIGDIDGGSFTDPGSDIYAIDGGVF